eukprot:scaffold16649_cov79-Skeletonema_dohrnii-CCMP3373.AAC.2
MPIGLSTLHDYDYRCLGAILKGSRSQCRVQRERETHITCMQFNECNCQYMSCYEAGGGNGTHHYKPFVAPDWRTCNATGVP